MNYDPKKEQDPAAILLGNAVEITSGPAFEWPLVLENGLTPDFSF